MNIEKINKLYENMMSLQELFEEELNPVGTINGLRMASAEFRSAFFKVRETLLECKVSSNATVNNRRPSEKKEEKSEEKKDGDFEIEETYEIKSLDPKKNKKKKK